MTKDNNLNYFIKTLKTYSKMGLICEAPDLKENFDDNLNLVSVYIQGFMGKQSSDNPKVI